MEDTAARLARLIHDPDGLAQPFIDEWLSVDEYVTANTSGSTGTPKPVRLLKSDMLRSAEATCRFFGITAADTMVLPLSSGYIAGKMMIVRSLTSGAVLHVEQPSSTPLFRDYGDIALLPVVPAQLDSLLKNGLRHRVRNLLIGGAPLSPVAENAIRKSGIKAFASYGMTETCSHVALRDITSGDVSFTTLPGITVSADSRGCLVIKAPRFSFGRLVTNDVADIIDSRRFVWRGRYDNVINSGGVKLHPEQIERQLAGIITSPFYITGRQSDRWGEEAVLYIEAGTVDEDMILEKARGCLDRYSMPKAVIAVPRFERTATGKIRRVAL